jgi:hypothetical protein
MGHYLHALIGRAAVLAPVALEFPGTVCVPLPGELALVPVTDEFWEAVDDHPAVESDLIADNVLERGEPGLYGLMVRLSQDAPVVYVETDYAGGVGRQAAVLAEGGAIREFWGNGEVRLVGESTAINQALRRLGVVASDGVDEFDTLGLRGFRDTNDLVVA